MSGSSITYCFQDCCPEQSPTAPDRQFYLLTTIHDRDYFLTQQEAQSKPLYNPQ